MTEHARGLGTWLWLAMGLALMSGPGGGAEASPKNSKKDSAPTVQLEVRDVLPLGPEHGHVVMLVTRDSEQIIPILVDTPAAIAISFRLAHRAAPYPLAEDLLDDVVKGMGGEVTRVEIHDVHGNLFRTRVTVQQGQKKHHFTARPSDSIAMALTSGAKIFASEEVLTRVGIKRDDLMKIHPRMPDRTDEEGVGGSGPVVPSSPHGYQL